MPTTELVYVVARVPVDGQAGQPRLYDEKRYEDGPTERDAAGQHNHDRKRECQVAVPIGDKKKVRLTAGNVIAVARRNLGDPTNPRTAKIHTPPNDVAKAKITDLTRSPSR